MPATPPGQLAGRQSLACGEFGTVGCRPRTKAPIELQMPPTIGGGRSVSHAGQALVSAASRRAIHRP